MRTLKDLFRRREAADRDVATWRVCREDLATTPKEAWRRSSARPPGGLGPPERGCRRDSLLQRERHSLFHVGGDGGRGDDDQRDRAATRRPEGSVRNQSAVGPGGQHRRRRGQRRLVHPRGPHRRVRQRHGTARPRLRGVAGYRHAIGGQQVAMFGNITPEFSRSVGGRTVADRAASAAYLGVDALLISGPAAGVDASMSDLREAKEAVDIPVLANTGVKHETIEDVSPWADAPSSAPAESRRGHLEPGRPRARGST